MIRTNKIRVVCVVLAAAALLAPAKSVAQDSFDGVLTVLPDDVVGFLAIAGGDAVGADFEKSHVGKVWNDPGVRSFCEGVKKELLSKMAKAGGEDENIAKFLETLTDFVKPASKRPLVFGLAQGEVEEGPPVYAFAILQAGRRKSELASALGKLEALVGEDKIAEVPVGSLKMHTFEEAEDVPLYWGWVGTNLVFAINDAKGAATEYAARGRRSIPRYLERVPGKGNAMAAYLDFHKGWDIVEAIGREEGGEEELKMILKVIEELGLSEIKTFSGRMGFSGTDMVSDAFLEVPAPRTGLLSAVQPIEPSLFDMVDSRAMTASAVGFDIGTAYDAVMDAVRTASPSEAYPELQKAIAMFEGEAKVNLRGGLLANLTGPAVMYSFAAGAMPEAPLGGAVAVIKVRNGASVEKSLTAIGNFAAAKTKGMLQVSTQSLEGGKTMHVWMIAPVAMMQMIPSWSVVDDKLVIGTNNALCRIGIEQAGSKAAGKSLRDISGFKKVASKLPANLISLSYTDSKVQFNQMMMQFQQFWPMLSMMAAQSEITLPAMLPSLGHIAEQMEPSCDYAWFGPEGIYSHYEGPGTELTVGAVAGAAIGGGMMMPVLTRTRVQAQRVAGAANLASIGKALLIYANDYEDKFPPNLEELVEKVELSPRTLESPRKPKGFTGPSYIYITGQNTSMVPQNILVYENPEYCSEKINVLFMDTHVSAMSRDEFLHELGATYKRLGREMPKVKFKD
jgi:hypothetical protein